MTGSAPSTGVRLLYWIGAGNMQPSSAPTLKKAACARLKTARLAVQAAHGITHADFCRTMQIGASALSNCEVGRSWPSPMLLIQMKERFGVPADYILTGSIEGLPRDVTKQITRSAGLSAS